MLEPGRLGALPYRMPGPLESIGELMHSLPWRVGRSVHRETAHVNIHETGEAVDEFCEQASRCVLPASRANGTDSRVGLGCIGHGRSSSIHLNPHLRRLQAWETFCEQDLSQFWLQSEDNIGDDPSRFRALRPLRIPPPALVPKAGAAGPLEDHCAPAERNAKMDPRVRGLRG